MSQINEQNNDKIKKWPYRHWQGSHQLIYELIMPNKKIIDFGCSTGNIGAKLINEKGCQVYGVEKYKKIQIIARQRLNDCRLGDISKCFKLPNSYKNADYLIFADILEHLENPGRILAFYSKYLTKKGKLIVSIPNVANWLNRLKLSLGQWDYKESGLLDRTHLRFFNYRTSKYLITQKGFKIEKVYCTSGKRQLDLLLRKKNPANFWRNLLAFQFIFLANFNQLNNNR